MPFWRKRKDPETRRGLHQRVLQGAPREEILESALAELVDTEQADRFGIWLESSALEETQTESSFRGLVWDRDAETTPKEWRTLAPQTVLPSTRLLSGSA